MSARRKFLVPLALAAVTGVCAVLLAGGLRDDAREVRLVARGMTFYAQGIDGPNPVLRFKAGERVRLSVTNEDPGYEHNLAVPGLGIRTPLLRGGAGASVLVTVPAAPGTSEYHCEPHAGMMRGNIAIE
jgi:FtsP/CotA-like multicopper oxidase with cupredoxin domain